MKESMKRVLAVLVAVVLATGILAACGNGGTASTAGNTPADASTAPVEGDEGIGTPKAIRGDKSVVVAQDWPMYIDPGVGSKASDSTAYTNMYDTLVFPQTDGTTAPMVAESWDVNADSTVYTFHLRDDINFHSGNMLTASDVKFSMDRLMTMGEGYAYIFTGTIDSTEVVDEHTVRFNLLVPTGNLPGMLIRLYILDEQTVMANIKDDGSYGEFGDYGKEWLMTNDAGSGPYRVREMRTEEYLVMEKFPDYWQGWDEYPDAPESIKMLGGIDGTTGRTMLSRGELDFSDDGQTPETIAELEKLDGLKLTRIPLSTNFNIMLNTKMAPTDDVHVRRAMAYALDYQSVIDNIYLGSSKPTGPIVKGLKAAALSEEDMPYHFNLDEAKAELEQSPYYDDLMSGAMTIALTWCSEGGAQQEKLALLMQAGMEALGVSVEVTGKPFANMMTDAQTVETTPNACFVVFAPPYLDGGGYLKARYHSDSTGSWEQMEWLQDPEIDAMIDEANTIADEAERNEMFREISRKLVDLCPSIWVVDLAHTSLSREEYILETPASKLFDAGEDFIFATGYSPYFRGYRVA